MHCLNEKMNQLCKVCGEPAAGYHFGAFTCEGCKSFFGRTYNNLAALGECKNNGQCVINKKNRTSCKSCRLKKCLMVGMSKSGSRYGRRSNWFKIHCLIQDQQEMTNRLAEQGVLANNGQLGHTFNENKDLLSQYKHSQESFRETSSASNHVSPRGASPNSSDGSVGGTLSSPYSSLFDTTKGNPFTTRYGSTSPSYTDSRKEVNNHHFGFHPSGLPLSPVSPLSPLNAAASRFFFHNSSASSLFGKGVNGMHGMHGMNKLYNGDLNYAATYQSRFHPIHALNPVLKSTHKETDINQNLGECYADVPEQDRPIDLSFKRANALSEVTLRTHSKSSKHSLGDHDSGFSPSSNEENNNNTSPLDLTSKRTPDPPIGEENEEPSDSDEEEQHSQLQSSDNK